MINLSENNCYLTVIRPPTKSIHHCATDHCEIERVSYLNKHADLGNSEYKIRIFDQTFQSSSIIQTQVPLYKPF
jgi:stress-induced morphogen